MIKKKHHGSFSNGIGRFSMDEPLNVCGIFTGVANNLFKKDGDPDKIPCVYVITKDDSGSRYKSYLESLEITIDTIQYVLQQPDKEKYVLHWSG